ncbi:MAG: peptidase C11 [Eubacterium sp.]|nr:peptidase C11 [Eubacterium sp.]
MEPNSNRRGKNVTGESKPMKRRGEGLGTGPVGRADGYAGRTGSRGSSGGSSGSGSGGQRAGGGLFGGGKTSIIAVIIALLLGGGGGLTAMLAGGGSDDGTSTSGSVTPGGSSSGGSSSGGSSSSGGGAGSVISSLLGGFGGNGSTNSASWFNNQSNTGKLNREVDPAAAPKRTKIKGSGQDTVTIMVYMCGTDLESRSGMATNDMREMAAASLSDKVNILLYTGGCTGWRTSGISNSTNQIYKIQNGQLAQLVSDAGNKAMTDPATLTEFIQFSAKNYPADRYDLIFWDHGGGSISGFGYDERFKRSGSMDLTGMNTALKNGGVTFDFIGFDACLMATLETGIMCSNYADYMIASEETEPGIGWYYTDWLNALSKDTSMATIDIGKNIVDGFVDECARKCGGQKTTLSVIDLAEFSATIPSKLSAFSKNTSSMIKGDSYKQVSEARAGTREFSTSGIDQVDLVHFAEQVGTTEAKELSKAIQASVKYNRTSSNMTNAYGVSIYFPYRKTSSVSTAVSNNNSIGVNSEYNDCIKAFASLETSGQIAAGGAGSPITSLLGGGGSSSGGSSDMISGLLSAFLGGRSVPGVDAGAADYMSDMDVEAAASYIAEHQFDQALLKWDTEADGTHTMSIKKEDWAMIENLQVNVFYDDGTGYVDLGLDNLYEFDDEGKLVGDTDGTWFAIDGLAVPYYFESEMKDENGKVVTQGRVPVLLDGVRANLIIVFDSEHTNGYIAGARYDYKDGETETIAKGITEIPEGTKIDFLADYYKYDQTYDDSFMWGEQITYSKDIKLSYVTIGDGIRVTYLLTDIYGREYWTPAVPN